jgi:hypothetical protein
MKPQPNHVATVRKTGPTVCEQGLLERVRPGGYAGNLRTVSPTGSGADGIKNSCCKRWRFGVRKISPDPERMRGRGRFVNNDMVSSQIRVELPARVAHLAHVVPAPASAILSARLVAWVRSEPAVGAMDLQRLGTGRHLHRE